MTGEGAGWPVLGEIPSDGSDGVVFDDHDVGEESGLIHGNPPGGCPLCPETCYPIPAAPARTLPHRQER
jgi:hypothetical protein